MKKQLLFLAIPCLLACQQNRTPAETPWQAGARLEQETKNKTVARTFEEFIASPSYTDSRDMWRGAALAQSDPKNSRVEILLRQQRGRLYINNRIAMDFPVCSGRIGGHETPKGKFRISEKKREHRSTLYGSHVDKNGKVVDYSATAGKKAPGGTRFVGTLMPYWMRFNGAIGMHVGNVFRSGASHGCVRVPEEACSILFEKLSVGSTVIVK